MFQSDAHRLAGHAAAAKSPKTPAHLRAHQQKLATMKMQPAMSQPMMNGGPTMAKLTTAARKAIPTGQFAGPDRSYPIEDASHARNALARVSQFGSPALKKKVRAKVRAKYPGIAQKSPIYG